MFGGYAGSMDSERMLHWMYGADGDKLQRQYRDEKDGIVSIPLFIRTAEAFLHSRKPVKTLADLKGLKLRTAGAWLEMAKDLGAAPVTTAGGDVYPMLERGAIDATEWGTLWENITPGFHKVAKYLIIPGRAPADRAVRAVHQQGGLGQGDAGRPAAGRAGREARDLRQLDQGRRTRTRRRSTSTEGGQRDHRARRRGAARRRARSASNGRPKTAKEGNARGSRKVLKSQDEFEKPWKGAERWRTIKVKD